MSIGRCRECGKAFTYATPQGPGAAFLRLMLPTLCTPCTPAVEARMAEEERAKEEAAKRAKRAGTWEQVCPPLYRDTDPARLPEAARAAIAAYRFGPRGLGLAGLSGAGKTRALLLLLHRLHVGEGKRAAYVPSSEFGHRVSRLSGAGSMEEFDAYINGLCRVPALLLDDVGKGRLTDRVEAELYHVIETRTANLRPVFFTANADANGLAGMMSEDRGVPIVRRLGEFCQIVAL